MSSGILLKSNIIYNLPTGYIPIQNIEHYIELLFHGVGLVIASSLKIVPLTVSNNYTQRLMIFSIVAIVGTLEPILLVK